ncbi:MAG: NapC/NirT family cytochrome c [Rhodocyclaceae bacterium]|nr:NapC/NirT family cytochrome c [Rhodocyclaceae bacterium]
MAGVAAALLIALLALEPTTRALIATDAWCTYCHQSYEFSPAARVSATKPHKATPKEGDQARCGDCHIPPGVRGTVYSYAHFLSLTDFFGHARAIDEERRGEWLPSRAKTAYRVREKMELHDSSPCRTCHVESEIKPQTERGVNAHDLALKEKKTCIGCHYNLVHRTVDLKEEPPKAAGGEAKKKESGA